jgi:hypothetical protein
MALLTRAVPLHYPHQILNCHLQSAITDAEVGNNLDDIVKGPKPGNQVGAFAIRSLMTASVILRIT